MHACLSTVLTGLTAIGGSVRTNELVNLDSFHEHLLILNAKSQVRCIDLAVPINLYGLYAMCNCFGHNNRFEIFDMM